jgi:hypothetical protein
MKVAPAKHFFLLEWSPTVENPHLNFSFIVAQKPGVYSREENYSGSLTACFDWHYVWAAAHEFARLDMLTENRDETWKGNPCRSGR